MKKTIYLWMFICLVSVFNACKSVYKCGEEPTKKITGSKRLKNLVTERDALCNNLAESKKDNDQLKKELEVAKNEIANLNGKYNQLFSDNLSQAEQFNAALNQKSKELNEKEKLLADRERAIKEMQKMLSRQDSITKRLNDLVKNALLGFNSDELSVEIKNGKVYVMMTDKLLFKSGSATVENKGKEALKVLAEVLNKNPEIDILIEGHTDNVPIRNSPVFKDNWDLSVVRATSIVRILTEEYKVSPLRVTASGKGEFNPRASNDSPEGRTKNRRTEIILSPKLDELMNLLNTK